MDEQSIGPRHSQLKGLNETEQQKILLALNNITQKVVDFWKEQRNSWSSTTDESKIESLYQKIEEQLRLFQIDTERMTADDGHTFFKLKYEFIAYYTDPYACVIESRKRKLNKFCLYYLLMERYVQDNGDYAYKSLTYEMLNFTATFMKANIPYVQKISEHLSYIEVIYNNIQEVQDVLTGLFDNYLYYNINYMPQCYEIEESQIQKVKISQILFIRFNKHQLSIINITPQLPPTASQHVEQSNDSQNKQVKEIQLSQLQNIIIQLVNKKRDCINVISTYKPIKNLQMNAQDTQNTDKVTVAQAHKQMLQWQADLQTTEHKQISNNMAFFAKYKYNIRVIPQDQEQLIDRFSVYITYQSNKSLILATINNHQNQQSSKRNESSQLNTSQHRYRNDTTQSATNSFTFSYQKKQFVRPTSPPFQPVTQFLRYDIEYPIFYRQINLESCYFYLFYAPNHREYFKTLTQYINTGKIINKQLLPYIKEDVIELKIQNLNKQAILYLYRIFKQADQSEVNVFDIFNKFLLFIQKIAIDNLPFPKTFDEFGLDIYTQKQLQVFIVKDYDRKELEFAYEKQQTQIADYQVFTDLFTYILQINDVICFQCNENVYYYDENKNLQIINIVRSVQQLLMRKHPTYFYVNYIDLTEFSAKPQNREYMLDYVMIHCNNTVQQLSNHSYYKKYGQVIQNDQFKSKLYDSIIRSVQYDFTHGNYLQRHYIEYIINKEDGEYYLQSLFNMTQNEGVIQKILENTHYTYTQNAHGPQQYTAHDQTYILIPEEVNIQLNTIDYSQVLEVEVTTLLRSQVQLINQSFSNFYYMEQYIKRQINIQYPIMILKIKSQELSTLLQLQDKQLQKIKEILVEKNDQNDVQIIHYPGYLVFKNEYVKPNSK